MDMMWSLARLPYGDKWRRGRKLLHAHVHQGVVHQYYPIQLASARRFAQHILSVKPDKEALAKAVRANFGRTIIKIVYGVDAPNAESEYISLPEKVLVHTVQGGAPGRWFVDSWPIREWADAGECQSATHAVNVVKYVPAWLPGVRFQDYAKRAREDSRRLRDKPIADVVAEMVCCFTTALS
jgi:hypothetical protein